MPTLTSAQNLGPAVVRSIPVWASVVVNGADNATTAVSQHYISRADFTLVRPTTPESFTAGGVSVKQTIIQNFTKYSQKLTVTRPAACRGKSTGLTLQRRSGFDRTGRAVVSRTWIR